MNIFTHEIDGPSVVSEREPIDSSRPSDQPTLLYPAARSVTELAALNFARDGVLLEIINLRGELLILNHRATARVRLGEDIGPPTETSLWVPSTHEVESLLDTASRCITEELGVDEPQVLGLRAEPGNTYREGSWPAINGRMGGVRYLRFFIDDEGEYYLSKQSVSNDEIMGYDFMSFDQLLELAAKKRVRPGVCEWLGSLAATNVSQPTATLPVQLRSDHAKPQEGWQDISVPQAT